jgi:hypothetical protein
MLLLEADLRGPHVAPDPTPAGEIGAIQMGARPMLSDEMRAAASGQQGIGQDRYQSFIGPRQGSSARSTAGIP